MGEVADYHRRKEVAVEIATLIHAYDHPEWDTCTYCVFCITIAENVLDDLPPK